MRDRERQINIQIERARETKRQTDIETNRQTEIQTDRETDPETGTHNFSLS